LSKLLNKGSKFKVQSSRFKVQGSKFKVQNSRFKIQGSKFKVQNSRFKRQSYCPNSHTPKLPHSYRMQIFTDYYLTTTGTT